MNLGKGASFSEESDSFKLCLNSLFEKRAMFFTGPMLHQPPQSLTWEKNESIKKPIHIGWDGDTTPADSY